MGVEIDPNARAAALALLSAAEALPARTTPALRALRRDYSRRWRNRPAAFIHGVARALHERQALRWVGYELIRRHPAAFAALDDPTLDDFSPGLASWDAVDAFGRILSGPAWAHGLCSDSLFDRWSASGDRWLRRAALVSTVALNMPADGGRGDAARTLAICRRLAGDPDDMVVKALSWALRALSVRDADPVRAFLAGEDARLAPRVKREVRHKLETGLKTPRKAG